jgi:hypothetical protein
MLAYRSSLRIIKLRKKERLPIDYARKPFLFLPTAIVIVAVMPIAAAAPVGIS